jgi:hypothetical protein
LISKKQRIAELQKQLEKLKNKVWKFTQKREIPETLD